jgi:hypothetical protein
MAPQLASARQETPAGREGPQRDDVIERLRSVIGPSGGPTADDLAETLRVELRREYERGYHDGCAITQRRAETGYQRFMRRLRRRMRHGLLAWQAPHSLARSLLRGLLIVVICAGAAAVSLKMSQGNSAKKPPAAGR